MLHFCKIPAVSEQADERPCYGPAPVALVPSHGDATSSGVQKGRSAPSRRSLLTDRQFLNEYKALRGIASYPASAASDVSSTVSVSKGYEPSDPLPSYLTKTPRHWRDAPDETQGFFAFEALQELGTVTAFTAWCSTEIDAKARVTGKPLAWLRKRLKEALDDELGPVEWFANLEEEHRDGKLRLHFHGAGAFGSLTRHRRKGIRKAMRRALGAWEGPAALYQVKLRIARDAGWVSYCTKRSWLALPGIRLLVAGARPGSMFRLSFEGDVFTMTNGVRARAKKLHQQAREIVIEARGRAKAPTGPFTAPELETHVPDSPRLPRGALPAFGEPAGLAPDASAQVSIPETHAQRRPMTAARSRDPPP